MADWATTFIAFFIFNIIRYNFSLTYAEGDFGRLRSFMTSGTVVAEMALFPLAMLGLYWLSGFYHSVFFKSRLQVVGNTLLMVGIGTLAFFMSAMLNDHMPMRRLTYWLILIFYGLTVLAVGAARLLIATYISHKIHTRKWGKPTLIVGAGPEAGRLVENLGKLRRAMGFKIMALVDITGTGNRSGQKVPVITFDEIAGYCRHHGIETVIIASDSSSYDALLDLVGRLMPLDLPILIKPDMSNPAIRAVAKVGNVAGEPLVDISRPRINGFTINVKRVGDVLASAIALLILSPLFALIAAAVTVDSRGPVFYRQERVGYHRRKFRIIKFRSMKVDAEASGTPMLSSADDPRVTRVGRLLRKYRLDELPNFWNVLTGDMSLVGPRPEREYYVNRLLERAPFYSLVHSVRPGITSWGMVKFGYAGNIEEMLGRLEYDILYVENMSISTDLKILFYTIHTVITGKGV